MKKMMLILLTFIVSTAAATAVLAAPFDHFYNYKNEEGTYSYYFTGDDFIRGLFVTMDVNWIQNTFVKTDGLSATFYQRKSYDAYAETGMEGGRLFTIAASVNTDFQDLPSFEYIGFDDETNMNYFVEFPTDYQAYVEDESIRAEYDTLWAGVKDVVASIRFGNAGRDSGDEDTDSGNSPDDTDSSSDVMAPDDYLPKVLTSGDYEYYVNEDAETVTVTGYYGNEEIVEIPSEIDGHPVTDIGEEAFSYGEMKRITFPETLRRIGYRAFEYCELENVVIPAGAAVEACAFGYCDSLKQVLIEKDAVIRSRAFGYCERLEKVVCAKGSRLEEDTFEYCYDLEEVLLCGEVEVEDGAFSYCDKMKIERADEDEFEIWNQLDDLGTQFDRLAGIAGGLTGGGVTGGGVTGGGDAGGGVTDGGTKEGRPAGGVVGGWEVTEDAAVPEHAREVFEKAMPDHDRVDYEPVALLATQLVAGRNYCFLRRTVMDEPGAMPSYELVYLYENLKGDVQVLEVQNLEFGLGRVHDGKEDKTETLPDGEHRITLAGDVYLFADCPESAQTGDLVVVSTADVTDGEVMIEVNGADTGKWQSWGTYIFMMPDEDVELTAWVSTEGYPGA